MIMEHAPATSHYEVVKDCCLLISSGLESLTVVNFIK